MICDSDLTNFVDDFFLTFFYNNSIIILSIDFGDEHDL